LVASSSTIARHLIVTITMGDYTINLSFTKEQVAQLNTQGFKLCFSSGVGSDANFNVIAWSDSESLVQNPYLRIH
jgi:hypothetical protein